MTLTLEAMHRDVAAILHEDPSDIHVEDNLIDVGLDSVRAMALMERWNSQGAHLVFSALAERPTLQAWWHLVAAGRSEAS